MREENNFWRRKWDKESFILFFSLNTEQTGSDQGSRIKVDAENTF